MAVEGTVALSQPVRVESWPVRRFLVAALALLLLHTCFMLVRYGRLPSVPVIFDEVVINDPSIAISRGHGYVAESFADSKYGLDRVYAHFPPVYPYTEALAFRMLGISAYTLRLTTTVMSIGSTVVLLLLLYRMAVFGLLRWDVALLVYALYCTNASYIASERVARMESMIGFLVLVSLAFVLRALTVPDATRWPWLLSAGVSGALTVAVHPEAVTAVLLLVALMLFVVPSSRAVRSLSAAFFVLIPLAVGIGIYRAKFFAAIRQFLAIAHDSNAFNPTSYQWMMDALRTRDVSTFSRNVFLLLIMGLFAGAPMIWVVRRRALGGLQRRMCACMAFVGVLEILVMIFALRMNGTRCEFLFGTLLVCDAFCLWGADGLRRWQAMLGWTAVALQCGACLYYLSPRAGRVENSDPDRFARVVQRLPVGLSIASTPGLWLDLQEQNRPFAVILNGLDGEAAWGDRTRNPLHQFDIVILEGQYSAVQPWIVSQAQEGRTKQSFHSGSELVDVYVRQGSVLRP